MTTPARAGPTLVVAAAVLALGAGMARGGGAFLINGDGDPVLWDTSQPIVFNIDQGPLGQLTPAEAQALAEEAFAIWGQFPTASSVSFQRGPDLPCDLDAVTVGDISGGACGPDNLQIVADGNDGLSPVIFDADGSLIDFILGIGAGDDVLGFATIVSSTFLPPVIAEAEIILNGRWFDGVPGPESDSQDAFQAVFVHENGHWLNLDHSQLNIQFWLDGDGPNDDFLPTMFPSSGDDDSQLLTLAADDVATLIDLYPAAGVSGLVGRIQGEILAPGGGGTPFQGANVVLRSVSQPFSGAYSSLSGSRYVPDVPLGSTRAEFGGPVSETLHGSFSFLVAPGTYILEVEEVEPVFTDGSEIGPLVAPVLVPGSNEFWNEGESADPAADPPGLSTEIVVTGGQILPGMDILLNVPPLPALLYAVDGQLFDPNDPGGPTAIIELDQATMTVLRRIPAPEINSAFQEGLAYAASRGTLFFTDGGALSQDIYELDPVDGTVLNTFPWPAGAQRIDGLAFLDGPNQPAGGVLYALDSDVDMIFGLDPDTGGPKGSDIIAGDNLFGSLGGAGDDLFVTATFDQIIHLHPADLANPVVNFFTKPGLKQFDPGITSPGLDQINGGLGYDGEDLYATSLVAPDYRIWRIDPLPATDGGAPTTRLDVMTTDPDPTPNRPFFPFFGGFSAAAVAMRGDINGSLRVDGFDLASLARAFGSSAGNPAFKAGADLDRDDDVDGDDLNILAAYFGRGLGSN
jgi:hypothetical protein